MATEQLARQAQEPAVYRISKRREFEDRLKHDRSDINLWIKYSKWEASQNEPARARSICERALEEVVGYRNPDLWCGYAEIEMKNNFLDRARKVLDRAVTLHPRVNQLWLKFIQLEEKIGNIASARTLFERWMCWMPDHQGWLSYIKFEVRYNETERARQIFERFVQCHPKVECWISYAKFEMKNGEVDRARNVHGRAVEKFTDGQIVGFPEFEGQCKETERARCINKRIMPKRIPKGREEDSYKMSVVSEKRYGDKKSVLGK